MASLHELIMGNAFKAFIENAQRETTNMQDLALYSAKLAQDKIAEEQKAEQSQRDYASSLAQGMKIASSLNDDKSRVQATVGVNQDGKISASFSPIRQESDAEAFKAKREERIARQSELNNATRLRTEFINRPEVKDFVTVNTNVNAMDSLLNMALAEKTKENYVAIDQGLITMYNKLTDPQSVVRESEYARTPENLPIVNRIQGAIGKIKAGGAGLTDEDRKALVEGAKIILKERASPYNSALVEYTDLASQYGLDSSMVTRGMQPYQNKSNNEVSVSLDALPTFKNEAEVEAANLPIGTIVIINGRKARIK